MASIIASLVGEIKALQAGIEVDETNVVLKYVKIGERLIKLKRKARGTWTRCCHDLGYEPRVAARLMTLANSWWAEGGLEQSGLVSKLPPDVLKLEWMSKLSRVQLQEGLNNWPCRAWSRSNVIEAVKHKLNLPIRARASRRVTLDSITVECARFVNQTLEALEASSAEMDDPAIRQQLLDDLCSEFAKVENALSNDPANPGTEEETSDTAAHQVGQAQDASPVGLQPSVATEA